MVNQSAGTDPKRIADLVDDALSTRPPAIDDQPDKVPERVTLDQLDTTLHPAVARAVGAARKWAERKRNGQLDASLVLVGPFGSGKTHIARAILWSIIQVAVDEHGDIIAGTERPVGRFFVANDLIQLLDSNSYASSLVGNAPLIVIDDVGAEQRIDYAGNDESQLREKQQRYFKIINHCYDFQVSVIVTSNLNLNELSNCLGGRAWSRLAQMAPTGFMVDLSGVPDFRMRMSGR